MMKKIDLKKVSGFVLLLLLTIMSIYQIIITNDLLLLKMFALILISNIAFRGLIKYLENL